MTPQATDRTIELHVADGSVIEARETSSLRCESVSSRSITSSARSCQPTKETLVLLLGQTFINQFTHKIEGGRLILSKVETETSATKTSNAKKTAKSKRSTKTTTGKNTAAVRGDPESP